MCDKSLEKYKILYKAYADEIRNLWQRSAFLGAFMTLAWGGYGALQLKAIEKYLQNYYAYCFASLGICLVIIVLSLLWIAMAKGSKFVQEAHEEHIKKFVEKDADSQNLKGIYCDLRDYEYLGKSENLFSFGALTPFRYSPSKINIALGWISACLAGVLMTIHILIPLFSSVKLLCNLPIATLIVIAIMCVIVEIVLILYVFYKMKDCLKGGN